MEFVIDEELRSLILSLSQEEYAQLEQNILEFGCLDALKVWPVPDSDEVILLDGHNRFKICSENNVDYETKSISLIDRAAAIRWMVTNQLGRRNLSAKQVSFLRGKQYEQERQEITNPEGSNQYVEVVPHFAGQPLEPTAARIAKQYRVNKATIERDAEYAKAVDAIVAATAPEVQQQILGADSKLTKLATLKLAKFAQENPAAMPDILEEVQQAPSKTAATAVVQRCISEIEESPVDKETSPLADCDPLILKLLLMLAGSKGNSD